jgi:hypothetical protein
VTSVAIGSGAARCVTAKLASVVPGDFDWVAGRLFEDE